MRPGSDCFFHEDEHALPTDFLQCFECGHSYRTEGELREAAGEIYADFGVETPPTSQIFTCPLCAHDF